MYNDQLHQSLVQLHQLPNGNYVNPLLITNIAVNDEPSAATGKWILRFNMVNNTFEYCNFDDRGQAEASRRAQADAVNKCRLREAIANHADETLLHLLHRALLGDETWKGEAKAIMASVK